MNMMIDWEIPLQDYDGLFACADYPNLLQDPAYGRAHSWFYGVAMHHGLISIDGSTAGIFQWFEKRALGGLIHTVMLDRGPIWLPGHGQDAGQIAFFHRFNARFPPRLGRRRRVIPELAADRRAELLACGLKPTPHAGYATHLVDLTPDPDRLRARLAGKWRSVLRKAEQLADRGAMRTEWTVSADRIKNLLLWHQKDRMGKDYGGAHPVLLKRLLVEYAKAQALLLGMAFQQDKPCSAVAVLCHGKGATYQLAWNDESARATGANNLLLWQAMLALQQRGSSCLDLGGFNDQTPGLQRFKAGLGGREVRLAGMFC